jgi:hypothetical protein
MIRLFSVLVVLVGATTAAPGSDGSVVATRMR